MIPQGYYDAHAVRIKNVYGEEVWAAFGRASTGTQQVLVMFEVIEEEHQGERVPWFGFFTPKSWERTIESLRHCGFEGDDLSTLNDQTLDQVVSIKVEHETHEKSGRVYARVAFVNASGGGVKLATPMSRDELRDFASMMKGRMAGTSASPTTAERDPLDGIPF